MLKLRKILNDERRTIKWLAEQCECTGNHISAYLNGRYRIHLKLAKRISKTFNNQITVEELMSANPPKNCLPKDVRLAHMAEQQHLQYQLL